MQKDEGKPAEAPEDSGRAEHVAKRILHLRARAVNGACGRKGAHGGTHERRPFGTDRATPIEKAVFRHVRVVEVRCEGTSRVRAALCAARLPSIARPNRPDRGSLSADCLALRADALVRSLCGAPIIMHVESWNEGESEQDCAEGGKRGRENHIAAMPASLRLQLLLLQPTLSCLSPHIILRAKQRHRQWGCAMARTADGEQLPLVLALWNEPVLGVKVAVADCGVRIELIVEKPSLHPDEAEQVHALGALEVAPALVLSCGQIDAVVLWAWRALDCHAKDRPELGLRRRQRCSFCRCLDRWHSLHLLTHLLLRAKQRHRQWGCAMACTADGEQLPLVLALWNEPVLGVKVAVADCGVRIELIVEKPSLHPDEAEQVHALGALEVAPALVLSCGQIDAVVLWAWRALDCHAKDRPELGLRRRQRCLLLLGQLRLCGGDGIRCLQWGEVKGTVCTVASPGPLARGYAEFGRAYRHALVQVVLRHAR